MDKKLLNDMRAISDMIDVERATEAKPSASAAPGIELPLPAGAYEYTIEGNQWSQFAAAYSADQMRAAIAAAREEAERESADIARKAAYWWDTLLKCARILDVPVEDSIPMGVLEGVTQLNDLRARLAEPEGEVVAWRRRGKHAWEYRTSAPTTATRGAGWLPLFDGPQAKAPQQPPAGNWLGRDPGSHAAVAVGRSKRKGGLLSRTTSTATVSFPWLRRCTRCKVIPRTLAPLRIGRGMLSGGSQAPTAGTS